jgi:hypothetical protein
VVCVACGGFYERERESCVRERELCVCVCVCVCVCAGKEARTRARAYTWALYLRLLAGSKVTGRAGLLSAQIESSSRSSGRSFLYNHLRISRRGLRVLRGAGSFGACGVQQMAQNCAIPAHPRLGSCVPRICTTV